MDSAAKLLAVIVAPISNDIERWALEYECTTFTIGPFHATIADASGVGVDYPILTEVDLCT